MARVITEVEVEVELDDFDDKELIEELEDRGYHVSEVEYDITVIEQYWNQGNHREAFVLLERKFPELRGISQIY